MKILVALGFFLVAGVLNSNLAQAEDAKKPAIKQTYVDLLGKVKVNPFSDDCEDSVDELIKAKCNRNGGPTAYDTAVRGLEELDNSIMNMINTTGNSIESDVSDDSSSEEGMDNFAAICGSMQILRVLVTRGLDAVKPCLDLEERQSVDLMVNVSFPVLEYYCENDGSNLLGFYETGGVECVKAKRESMRLCLRNLTSDQSTGSTEATTSSTSALVPAPFAIPKFAVDLEDCSEFECAQSCVVEQLNGCPQRTPSNFMNSVFNIMKRESGCTAILKAHAAQSSN